MPMSAKASLLSTAVLAIIMTPHPPNKGQTKGNC